MATTDTGRLSKCFSKLHSKCLANLGEGEALSGPVVKLAVLEVAADLLELIEVSVIICMDKEVDGFDVEVLKDLGVRNNLGIGHVIVTPLIKG